MHSSIARLTSVAFFIALLPCTGGCSSSPFITWKEQVKLNDSRVIVVDQKRRSDHGTDREAWLTINLPDFSPQPIVWHENLFPILINVDQGNLYVVGFPGSSVELKLYGNPRPPYVGFLWQGGAWKRIPFERIPATIYKTNMLVADFSPKEATLLTLAEKESASLNGRPGVPDTLLLLDPSMGNGQ